MENRVVIVTGGAQGIGFAIATRFKNAGNRVIIVDKKEMPGGKGWTDDFVRLDVTTSLALYEIMRDLAEKYGPLAVVVANAGHNEGVSTDDTDQVVWEQSIALNLTSVFHTFRSAMRHMTHGGRLIAISSLVGVIGQRNNAAYTAAKGGIIAYVKSLALEVAAKGITVNAICPHCVDTPLLYKWAETQPLGTLADMKENMPIGRWVKPEEVAECAYFLASGGAAAITGQALIMDGGYSLG